MDKETKEELKAFLTEEEIEKVGAVLETKKVETLIDLLIRDGMEVEELLSIIKKATGVPKMQIFGKLNSYLAVSTKWERLIPTKQMPEPTFRKKGNATEL